MWKVIQRMFSFMVTQTHTDSATRLELTFRHWLSPTLQYLDTPVFYTGTSYKQS